MPESTQDDKLKSYHQHTRLPCWAKTREPSNRKCPVSNLHRSDCESPRYSRCRQRLAARRYGQMKHSYSKSRATPAPNWTSRIRIHVPNQRKGSATAQLQASVPLPKNSTHETHLVNFRFRQQLRCSLTGVCDDHHDDNDLGTIMMITREE